MKTTKAFVSLGLCLATAALALAQGGTCNASFVKKSFKSSTRLERGYDIQFEVTVGCPGSGTFEYVVDLVEKGKVESQTVTANFRAEQAGTSIITVTFPGVAFKELKDVKNGKSTSCTCGS